MCDYIKIVKFKKNIGTNVRYKYIKIKKIGGYILMFLW